MDSDLQRLEDELKALVPQRLDPALLEYLAVSMGDEAVALDDSLASVEARLSRSKPSRLSAALSEKFAAPLERIPFQPEAKTVPFPAAPVVPSKRSTRSPWLAAAAAVALAGAWMGVKMSPQEKAGVPLAVGVSTEDIAPVVDSGHFQPATFDSDLQGTQDLGVKWNRQAKPMRVVRVTYLDRMKFLNEKGEEVVAEVPRVEYVVLPEQVD